MFGFIKALHADKTEIKVILRLSAAFLVAFVLYLIASYFIIRSLALDDMKRYLKTTAASVSQDFEYSEGTWNTNTYLSDTTTPSENPLYIFSLDGFLIDRMNVIGGFLDTSNFVYASSFATPKTILDVQDVRSGVNWTTGGGSWGWPLQDTIRLTQHFGKTPYSSSQSCGSGSIIKIKYIDHGDGVLSFYLHVQ